MKDFLQAIVYAGLFLVLFLPLVVANDLFFPFITGKNFGFRIIVEFVLAAWVVLALLDARYRPTFSWIFVTFAVFIGVITLAAILGENPATSFWSNYERMDGVVTIMHIFGYFLVLGNAQFSKRTWSIFLHTSVGVAAWVALYGLGQIHGMFAGSGQPRIDSTLGNSAYMAVYMLFHIFFVTLLFVRSKDVWLRVIYALIALLFVYVLLMTGTRGTFLGLVGGSLVAISYVALFGSRFPEFRKVALGGLILFVVCAGGFYAVRDTAVIQNNAALSRIANIDLTTDLSVRSIIWGMALEGVKERPILGWGNGNFNFVFNQQYKPELYGQEQWFDRVHDIFLDWLIAAGVVGFISYFSIMAAVVYYLFWLPLRQPERESDFNVLERAILLGLLVGYLLHNVVVFDNIISYIFYGTILAFIHARVGRPIKQLTSIRITERVVTQVAAPLTLVAVIAVVYFVNIPSYLAAGDIIDGMRAETPIGRLQGFDTAIRRKGFGDQEIVEQLAQQAMNIARDPAVAAGDKETFVTRAELELLRMIDEKPGDARLHIFLSNFYRATGALPQAKEQAALARSFSPEKPSMMVEQGVVELQMGNIEGARDFFKEAYDRVPEFEQARTFYAAMLVQLGQVDEAQALLNEPKYLQAFAVNDYTVSVVQQAQDLPLLAQLFEARIALNSQDAQNWASLSFVYYQLNEKDKAIETLKHAGEAIPSFKPQSVCIAGNIEAGRAPETPCTP